VGRRLQRLLRLRLLAEAKYIAMDVHRDGRHLTSQQKQYLPRLVTTVTLTHLQPPKRWIPEATFGLRVN